MSLFQKILVGMQWASGKTRPTKRFGLHAFLAGASFLAACATAQPGPLDVNREHAVWCGNGALDAARSFLAESPFASVETLTGYVVTLGDLQPHVVGVKLHARALPNFTPGWLERALRCYETEKLLAGPQAPADSKDPFWLKGSWVDIDVEPDQTTGGMAILLQTASMGEAQDLFTRAQALVAGSPRRVRAEGVSE